MNISTESDYAIRIVTYLYSFKNKKTKKEIVEACNVPKYWGAAIITTLVKSNILLSTQGKNGGIEFNKRNEDLTIFDIIKEFDDIKINRCLSSLKNCDKDILTCKLCYELTKINNEVINMMANIKIESLL